jgi:uncharacterized protein YodC (DUF2158 family)
MAAWKIGDVVVLKSGSPKMTVAGVLDDGAVRCDWFDKDGKAQYKVFSGASLEKASGPAVA